MICEGNMYYTFGWKYPRIQNTRKELKYRKRLISDDVFECWCEDCKEEKEEDSANKILFH